MAENEDSLQPWTVATVSAVTVLAFVAVCLRLLARFERKQKLWWDDWMILWSMVSSSAVPYVSKYINLSRAGTLSLSASSSPCTTTEWDCMPILSLLITLS